MRSFLTASSWRKGQAAPLSGGRIHAMLGLVAWIPGVLGTDRQPHDTHISPQLGENSCFGAPLHDCLFSLFLFFSVT